MSICHSNLKYTWNQTVHTFCMSNGGITKGVDNKDDNPGKPCLDSLIL